MKHIQIPKDKGLDNTLNLLLEGYQFIQKRCKKLDTDIFQTRLFCEDVICITGFEAAKLFYDNERFIRKGAAPKRVQKTLTGEHGVQSLDDEKHKVRKQLFMSIMTPERINILRDLAVEEWQSSCKEWEQQEKIVLFDETQIILCNVACKWAGVPLEETEVNERAKDFGMMIDGFGGVGKRYWQGRMARIRCEKWISEIIDKVRKHELNPLKGTALYEFSWHRDHKNKLLKTQIAAVELINILRPIVAIATYITFGAKALQEYPDVLNKIQSDDENYLEMVVQEIRRYYPFAPFVGARVRNEFVWQDYKFKKGTLVILDIYGTHHDYRLWEQPNIFMPERFKEWNENPYSFLPQGGGDTNEGHRCAGEWVTKEIMKVSLYILANKLDYDVPKQNLRYSLVRIPTLPKSRFIMTNVKSKF